MSDDYRRGQIAGLQTILGLLIREAFDPAGRKAFDKFLGEFESPDWEHESSVFLDGLTDSFSGVSLKIFADGQTMPPGTTTGGT